MQLVPPNHKWATLLDYLPREAIFLLCEPEQLAERADEYARQVPADNPFFIAWEEFQEQLAAKGMMALGLAEAADAFGSEALEGSALSPLFSPDDSSPVAFRFDDSRSPEESPNTQDQPAFVPHSALRTPCFQGLDAFRPLAGHAPELHVAEAQRREFFAQLHRWLRQGYAVHVFCNNEGERQRFAEIWEELGLESPPSPVRSPQFKPQSPATPAGDWRLSRLWTHIGNLSRGFLCDEAKLVVVTDAEIFGRYKVQRPRRLKSPHALATRSALDIDFTELEEGDYVVHLQHGIGKFLGLNNLARDRRQSSQSAIAQS